jgi:hypothetical protein
VAYQKDPTMEGFQNSSVEQALQMIYGRFNLFQPSNDIFIESSWNQVQKALKLKI